MQNARFSTRYPQKKWISTDECIETCVHQDIYDWMIRTAREDQINLKKENGQLSTYKDYSPENYFIGSLAQNAVIYKVQSEWGLSFDYVSPFYIPGARQDVGYDLIYNSQKIDVQGEPFRKNPTTGETASIVHKGTRFYVSEHKIAKGTCEGFLFCKVDVEREVVHIAGLVGFPAVERLETQPGTKGACKIVPVSLIEEGFRQFVFGA